MPSVGIGLIPVCRQQVFFSENKEIPVNGIAWMDLKFLQVNGRGVGRLGLDVYAIG